MATRQYFVAIQLPPSIHRGDIMLFRCLPPFRISHFTGDLTAIGNDTQTGPADMSWTRVFVGLCLGSTQIGRIVLADTLHVEFHPKKKKQETPRQPPSTGYNAHLTDSEQQTVRLICSFLPLPSKVWTSKF